MVANWGTKPEHATQARQNVESKSVVLLRISLKLALTVKVIHVKFWKPSGVKMATNTDNTRNSLNSSDNVGTINIFNVQKYGKGHMEN